MLEPPRRAAAALVPPALAPLALLALALLALTACGEDREGHFSDGPSDRTDCPTIAIVEAHRFEAFAYEASRPNAGATTSGEGDEAPACSQAGVLPWVDVTRDDAEAACQRSGFELCTLEEWLLTCGGPRELRFPYGTEQQAGYCNEFGAGGTGRLEPTGTKDKCVSDYGAYDVLGNAAEWVRDRSDEGSARHAGYSYQVWALRPNDEHVCDAGYHAPTPGWRRADVGFRCCREK